MYYKSGKMLKFETLLVVAAFSLLIFGCKGITNTVNKEVVQKPSPSPAKVWTIEELLEERDKSREEFNRKHNRMMITVTGELGPDLSNDYGRTIKTVQIYPRDKKNYKSPGYILCYFDESERDQFSKAKRGENLTVQGLYESDSLSPCGLVNAK